MRRDSIRQLVSICISAGLCLVAIAAFPAEPRNVQSLDRSIDLSGQWKFQTGDNPEWASPDLNDSSWKSITVPGGWGGQGYYGYTGIAWYRLQLDFAGSEIANQFPGIMFGFVDSSYEIYFDGKLSGGAGKVPPNPKMEYDRIKIYRIPPEDLKDNKLIIAVRVWKSHEKDASLGGLYEGEFLVGSIQNLVHKEFISQTPALLLTCLFFLVGLYHLYLYFKRRELKEYLWFGILSAFNATVYTFLRSQWKFVFSIDFLLLKELEYLAAFTMLPVLIQFLWPVLNRPIGRVLRTYQLIHVLLAALVFITPGLRFNLLMLPVWHLYVLGFIPFVIVVLVKSAWTGHPAARTIVVGLVFGLLAVINDIAVDRGLIQAPRLIPYGFVACVLSMSISLSNRFTRVYGEMDALRAELEGRVQKRTLELSERTRELSEVNSKLSDVNTKLSDRSRELAEASLHKTQFLANISHELRTPLNAIIGYSEILQEEAEDKAMNDFIPDLLKIRDAGKHLLGMINDILDFTNIEAGKVNLHLEPFKISTMIEDIGITAAPIIEKNGNRLEIKCSDTLGTMRSDIKRLRQVLLILLSNAAKFTERGVITISASRAPGQNGDLITLKVADTGIGMTDEQKTKLFQAFTQADTTSTRKFGGTGLGLALCKRVCQLMGGDITVQSEYGKGSEFTITLPSEVPDIRTETSMIDFTPELQLARNNLNGRHIVLVIDDDRSARDLMVRMISREGFRVITAWGGEEGLRLARDLRPEIITLDVLMPGIDGWTVLKEIKADPNLSKIPVIMITMEEDKDKGLLLGASDFMTKPIKREQLATVLSKYRHQS